MKNVEYLICPVCKSGLIEDNNRVICKNNHSYDIAKEGYLNLLLANKKHSQFPGDSKEQVLARRDFLDKNYFLPLVDCIENLLKDNSGVLLDAGCGTGYYLNNLKEKFNVIGIDISKDAVKIASKITKECVVVSSIFDMPIKSESVDVILNVFAPKPIDEFNRVLKDSGIIVEVIPDKYHMIELKDIMYENSYLNDTSSKKLEGFNLITEREVKYKTMINGEDIAHLISMTPYNFSGKMLNKNMEVTLHFLVKIWQK